MKPSPKLYDPTYKDSSFIKSKSKRISLCQFLSLSSQFVIAEEKLIIVLSGSRREMEPRYLIPVIHPVKKIKGSMSIEEGGTRLLSD